MAASRNSKLKLDLIGVPVLALVIAIIVMVNLLSLRLFSRADLTQKKIYTLADGTKKVLAGLDDIVKVEFYRSKNLPSRLAPTVKGVEDYLTEFKAWGGKNLTIGIVDPDDTPDSVQQMRILGIPELQFNVIESDRQEVRKGYLGMAVFYGDKREVIQAITTLDDFEYRLTSSIVKITQATVPTVGLWLGETDPSDPRKKPEMRYDYEKDFDTLRRRLMQQYQVEPVAFDQGKLVPDKITTLVIGSPYKATERDIYAIDQFVMRGGNLIALQELHKRSDDQSRADIAGNPVATLLDSYGIRINTDLVADERNQRAMFNLYGRTVLRGYPFWPKVTPEGFLKDDLATRGLSEVSFFWTSSLSLNAKEGQTPKRLAESSRRAMQVTLPTLLTPDQPELLNFPEQEPKVLVGALEGAFQSYFKGKEIPEPMKLQGDLPPTRTAQALTVDLSKRLDSTDHGHIVVAGSAFWLTTDALKMAPQNLEFFLNIVDSLEIGDKLVGVRMRDVGRRLITREMTEAERSWLKFLGTFGAAFLVVGFAGLRAAIRWRERKEYAEAVGYMKKDQAS